MLDDGSVPHIEAGGLSVAERDRIVLSKLGKKPVLKRSFGFISIFAFASTLLVAWETTLIVLVYGLGNGGSAGSVYEFIFIWFGVTLSFVVISELASMAPVSGGQYHWVAMLAPSNSYTFLSYITGWMTICGWQGATAITLYNGANIMLGIATLCNPSYEQKPWHGILISLALMLYAVLINVKGGVLLPRFEGFMLIMHILGFLAVLIPLAILPPHQSAKGVFTEFTNNAGQPSDGVSFWVGCVGAFLTFSAADGAIHMSEEIENASIVVPRAIISSYIFNGSTAFAMQIVALFSIQDLKAALDTTTGYPFIEIFFQATGSKAGAAVMAAIVNIMSTAALVSTTASASRQLWSFARDHGVPGWQWVAKVEKRTAVPLNAVLVTGLCSVLLQLINLGSTTVFQDLLSITVAGLYSSYIIAITLLLWRRITGRVTTLLDTSSSGGSTEKITTQRNPRSEIAVEHIITSSVSQSTLRNGYHRSNNKPTTRVQVRTLTNTVNAPLTWGPWYVPGITGIVLNAFACCFIAVMWFFSFWPTELPVTPVNMNYNSLLWGGVILFSIIWYIVAGRKQYSGPVVETLS